MIHDPDIANNIHTGSIYRYQHHALLVVSCSFRIGLAHQNNQPAARVSRIGDEPFPTIDDVLVAHLLNTCLDISRIR